MRRSRAIVITGSLYLAGAAIAFFDKIRAAMTTAATGHDFLHRDTRRRRPRDRRRHRARDAAPERHPRADRLREPRLPRRAHGHGLGLHEQVRGRLSGQALLRRLRPDRHRREHRHRPRQGALRRRARERAAALRLAGQHGRLLRHAQAGRHDHGHGPLARRPPHARPSALVQRPRFQGRRVRRAQGRRADRLRRDGSASPRSRSRG